MSFDIERIASLANLQLNQEEKDAVADKMDNILKFVESIVDLDLGEYTPSISSYEMSTVLREDTIGSTLSEDELALNVPKLDDSSIIVPQVIQK